MKRVSVKNWSILSLILLGASAVTAAVMPDNKSNKKFAVGSLRVGSATAGQTGGILSCVQDASGACTATVGSGTITTNANAGQVDSSIDGLQTENNTSSEGVIGGTHRANSVVS